MFHLMVKKNAQSTIDKMIIVVGLKTKEERGGTIMNAPALSPSWKCDIYETEEEPI